MNFNKELKNKNYSHRDILVFKGSWDDCYFKGGCKVIGSF